MFRILKVRRANARWFEVVVENGEGFQFLTHYHQATDQVELGRTIRSGSYLIGNPEDTWDQLHSIVRNAVEEYCERLSIPEIPEVLVKKRVRRRGA
jgi:hypothetical protein